jgi:hypothetical protein
MTHHREQDLERIGRGVARAASAKIGAGTRGSNVHGGREHRRLSETMAAEIAPRVRLERGSSARRVPPTDTGATLAALSRRVVHSELQIWTARWPRHEQQPVDGASRNWPAKSQPVPAADSTWSMTTGTRADRVQPKQRQLHASGLEAGHGCHARGVAASNDESE